jgi:nitrous oxidase accessory protein
VKHLFILILAILAGSKSLCATIEVCSSCPITTIKKGIEQSGLCDTVLVLGGTYSEGTILIDKPIYLIGRDNPVLDSKDGKELINIKSDYVTFEGFTLKNIAVNYLEDRAAIRVIDSRFFTISRNIISNTFFGIFLQKSSEGEVNHNEIVGVAKSEASSGNAIHLWYCERVVVKDNFVKGHRDGIYFEFVNKSLILHNYSEGNLRYGLHFMFSNDDNYFQNTFRRNGAGVAVMYSKNINMYSNLFEDNWGQAAYGLLLKDIHDSRISGNSFLRNTVGIVAETSNRLNLTNNSFSQNGWAIRITGGCQKAEISKNHFMSNSFDMAVHTEGEGNIYDGNFWSDYSGYDLDRDGVGDVPHRPMKLFAYVAGKTPEAIILLRSLFVDILNFSEKVSPLFTPASVIDNKPLMKPL